MFNPPKNPTRLKHLIYIICWIVLGLLIGFIVHALIETAYIRYALSRGRGLTNTGFFGNAYCTLPPWIQVGLPMLGIILGFYAGRYFWRKIYIERVWRY